MTKNKEKIISISVSADGKKQTTERIGVVYKKKDGTEWAHHSKSYHKIDRIGGVATIEVCPKSRKAAPAPE